MSQHLRTIRATRKAISKAKRVYVQPRFGVSETWLVITKKEALELLEGVPDDCTPEGFEMFTDAFGSVIDNCVYLG